ncbi:3-hydroxyacyl-CoA dehydrogenase NAD-binding domain-containing protein [Candidatus Spongiihabitans sp.]|uniref:3-hydroxyacyl-CoA dehydrogenase n=1 Tax=Candidatus Spongiihabitans sp. TaxID=3101308 RepID=UPI003C703295
MTNINLIDIERVAVLGSGTMGTGIAGICANAGFEVLLLDLEKASCDTAVSKIKAARLTAGRSSMIENHALLDKITTGSFEHDLDKIADCQWICEAIIEDVNIKREIFMRIEALRSDRSIISTNTSGIPLRDIYAGMPMRLQKDIAVTHFFNPVHIMKLVELVAGENTQPEVIATLADFLGKSHGKSLGKGVVYAKDTVNFIGNRIGCMWMLAGLQLAEKAITEQGLSIETVDALMSDPMGFPATGLYGLIDLVGLDVILNVAKNLEVNLPANDFGRKFIHFTDNIRAMVERGQLGRKTGGGFYQLIRHNDGSKTMQVFDIQKQQWRVAEEVELPEHERTLSGLFESDSANARFVKDVMATTLCYSADLVPEIADDIINVDRAMRWGFAWQRGPFELIDELGAQCLIKRVNAHGLAMPKMLQVLIDAGQSTFYRNHGSEFLTTAGNWERVPD